MTKAKLPFWQLTALFGIITIMAISLQWVEYNGQLSGMMTQMMGGSMGDMMRMMHASNISLNDLLLWGGYEKGGNKGFQASGQLIRVHIATTTIIFLLTPIILAGAMLLLAIRFWGE